MNEREKAKTVKVIHRLKVPQDTQIVRGLFDFDGDGDDDDDDNKCQCLETLLLPTDRSKW